ncbi:MAG: hypothetical protein EHM72_16245, partial [Calditrichaeota bacterium]
SPPAWMKTSGSLTGGRLKREYYAAYARYFIKFINAYAAAGIPVFALTVQNEPGVDREHDVPKRHYPSCHWTAEEQKDFIKYHLGPEFERNGVKSEIWCYDHNHNIKPMTDKSLVFISEKPGDAGISFPDVPVRFTEGSVFGLSGGVELMDILKNNAIIGLIVVMMLFWVTLVSSCATPKNDKTETLPALQQHSSLAVEIEGVVVTPHVYSKKLRSGSNAKNGCSA